MWQMRVSLVQVQHILFSKFPPSASSSSTKFISQRCNQLENLKMIISIQTAMDLIVAGFSLMFGFGLYALIAAVLCSVAFLHHVRSAPPSASVLISSRR
ncbi:hypothetical protein BRARA_G02832 [Brassica rapa]|uniref:Uncharacterized protein n=1 Tax=Brassica campestris TaxID=3711 RepID=A0A397YQ94_BRACM|nr:uncharacterized protein LOC103831299 [Brassica rapa]RID55579.1 hypothetical protein BRARA_G02832 [Brassica rapa]